MKKFVESIRAFAVEEDGIALTEYLVLLGLLIAGVIGAVTTAGGGLATAWGKWETFWNNAPTPSWPAPTTP